MPNTVLENTQDSYEISVPAGCDVEQFVVRKTPQFPEDRLWTVSQDLWNALDHDNRAGLVLHEIIYDEILTDSKPQDNSITARYYNSYLCSDLIPAMSPMTYAQFITKYIQLDSVTVEGIEVETEGLQWTQAGIPAQAYAVGSPIYIGKTKFVPEEDGLISFDPSGRVKSLGPIHPITIDVQGQQVRTTSTIGAIDCQQHESLGDYCDLWKDTGVTFYNNGQIKRIGIDTPNPVHLYGNELSIARQVEFDPAGNLISTYLMSPITIPVLGKPTQIVTPSDIEFFPNGQIRYGNTCQAQEFRSSNYKIKFLNLTAKTNSVHSNFPMVSDFILMVL